MTTDHAQTPSGFAAQVAALSEPAGYFDTDNLISNESSYQQVLPDLRRRKVHGGAYVGVGPDQNFTYIAETRPAIAFIIDVRRDNLLLHLLFKALFELSRTRIEYLTQLLGRPVPSDIDGWRTAPVDRLIAHAETPPRRQRRSMRCGRVSTPRSGIAASACPRRTFRRLIASIGGSSRKASRCGFRAPEGRRAATIRPIASSSAIRTDPVGRATIWPPKRHSNS